MVATVLVEEMVLEEEFSEEGEVLNWEHIKTECSVSLSRVQSQKWLARWEGGICHVDSAGASNGNPSVDFSVKLSLSLMSQVGSRK